MNSNSGNDDDSSDSSDFFDKLQSRFNKFTSKGNKDEEDTDADSEESKLLKELDTKPWRSSKVKYLTYNYLPWKDSWKERYRSSVDNENNIYIYSIPNFRLPADRTRIDEIWSWPWMWTKVKSERLSWMYKQFVTNVESVSVQEHMEIDALFSEYDMPFRWGMLRLKELDVLNVIVLQLVFWTDFNGIRPTDLGLRPDGSVRTCAVQFHNCVSSSNDPSDIEHYVPPFKWDRNKSPDQAYDEIKKVYTNYPKRGLKWSNGWIDRGGWKPQQFSGPYFYAQADTLVFQFTDDIELVLDNDKREVQYRSSTRIGQTDWDVERLRYNQFSRMLLKNGGWDVTMLDRQYYVTSTPFRWTQHLLDKFQNTIQQLSSIYSSETGTSGNEPDNGISSSVRKTIGEYLEYLSTVKESISSDPAVRVMISKIDEMEHVLQDVLNDNIDIGKVREFVDKVITPEPISKTVDAEGIAGDGLPLLKRINDNLDAAIRGRFTDSDLFIESTDTSSSSSGINVNGPIKSSDRSSVATDTDKFSFDSSSDIKIKSDSMSSSISDTPTDSNNDASTENDVEWLVNKKSKPRVQRLSSSTFNQLKSINTVE